METASLDAAFWITSGVIILLLIASAFFSGSETALTAASRGKLRSAADKGSKGAGQALVVTEDNERLIGSVLLGNNVVNILATSLATAVLTKLFGQNGVAVATLVMTLLVLIFAEVLPKTLAITYPETVASRAPFRLLLSCFRRLWLRCAISCAVCCLFLACALIPTATFWPCAKKSQVHCNLATPKGLSKKKTATASWARLI